MHRMMGMCAALAAVTAAWSAPAPARNADPIELHLAAAVEISPQGRITSLEWKSMRPGLDVVASRLEPKIRAWRFEPGAIDGVPQATRTHLSVRVLGEELSNGNVALRFADASTGAKMFALPPPRYPASAVRASASAAFVATVDVGEDSRVASVEAQWVDGNKRHVPRFEAALRDALAAATFEPERVGGRAVRTQMRISFDFCIEGGCRRLEQRRAAMAANGETPMTSGQAIALDSAVRLLTEVEGEAI